ncbi:hypothetical protein [Treponema sp. R80B11-R83G3]
MKNLLISIPCARNVRYFVDTKIFDDIANYCSQNDIHIYLVHKQETLSNFISLYKNITELRYPNINKSSKLVKLFRNLVNEPSLFWKYLFHGRVSPFKISPRDSIKRNILRLVLFPFSLLYYIPIISKFIINFSFFDINYIQFLKKFQIDAVILNLPECIEERLISHSCNKMKIPIVAGCDGWDTYLNNGYVHIFSGVMVWGKEMAIHAKESGIKEHQLIYIGMPHKSRIQHSMANMDKDKIQKKYNIDKDNKVILIPCNRWYQTNDMEKNFIKALLHYIENNKEINYIIILRDNPGGIPRKEDINYKIIYKNNKYIRFQVPVKSFMDSWTGIIENNIISEIAELFLITDCVFSITSLFMLEAAISNIPVNFYNIKNEKYNVRYATKKRFYKSLLNMGIPELTDYKDIPSFLNKINKKDNLEYLKNISFAFDYCEPNYISKLFSLLELINKE